MDRGCEQAAEVSGLVYWQASSGWAEGEYLTAL
jgi:hypothetical protein